MNLKSMKIAALVGLKYRTDAVLASKVSDERRALESELAKLTRFESGGTRSKSVGRGVRGKVAPKYRNPENPVETWAGRGLKPKWLAAAIKAGKKQDDFLIAGAAPSSKANGRKKARKARNKKIRSEEPHSELQSPDHFVCRLLLEKKKYLDPHATRQVAIGGHNCVKTNLTLHPKSLFVSIMIADVGINIRTMTHLSTEGLIQLTKL